MSGEQVITAGGAAASGALAAGGADAAAAPRAGGLAARLALRYEQLTPARALILVLVLGGLARFAHLFVFDLDRPLIMGGLFLEFAQAIAQNGFLLPERIPFYSEGGLPFLYPPLAFYPVALLVHVLGLPEGPVINLLPPLISLFGVWLFYLLARRVLPSWRQAALAAFLFALLPNALAEQVEAAGLAESLGTAMLLFLLIGLADLYSAPGLRRALICGLALGLCVLSAPGSAVGGTLTAVIFAVWFWLRHGAGAGEKLRLTIVVAAVSVLVAAPWLLHVLGTGAGTFAAAFANEMRTESLTGATPLSRLWSLVTEFPLVYPQVFLWQLLVGIGLLAAAAHPRARPAALWTLAVFVLVPREGRWLVAPGVAFLALIAVQTLFEQARRRLPREALAWAASAALLVLLFALFPYGSPLRAALGGYTSFAQAASLRDNAFAAFHWLRDHTPEHARVLVVTNDHTLEQAPHETRRTVINVLWGSEFEPAKWNRIVRSNRKLISCSGTAEACVLEALRALDARTMPLYVLAHSSWLDERSGPSEGLILLHVEGELSIFRLWPEPEIGQ